MRIHGIVHATRANGPGLRSAVWAQGCALACKGCQNPLTHAFNAGDEIDPDELAYQIIRDAAPGTEGLTISGGEPMHQAVSVYSLMCSIKARRPNWSIGMFTGYALSELASGTYMIGEPGGLNADIPPMLTGIKGALWTHQVCQYLDWVVAGRYDRTRPLPSAELVTLDPPGADDHRLYRPDLKLCSSANQCLHLISRRYSYTQFESGLSMEFSIDTDGLTQITGFQSVN